MELDFKCAHLKYYLMSHACSFIQVLWIVQITSIILFVMKPKEWVLYLEWGQVSESVKYNDQEHVRKQTVLSTMKYLVPLKIWWWAQDFHWRPFAERSVSWVFVHNFTHHRNMAVWSSSIISISKRYIMKIF